jgi:hypothetical protein
MELVVMESRTGKIQTSRRPCFLRAQVSEPAIVHGNTVTAWHISTGLPLICVAFTFDRFMNQHLRRSRRRRPPRLIPLMCRVNILKTRGGFPLHTFLYLRFRKHCLAKEPRLAILSTARIKSIVAAR